MYMPPMHSAELLKGTLQTIILKVLKNNGRMYGYEITQKVRELSGQSILLSEGSLYPALHRLEEEGLVRTETTVVGNRVRKYYALTADGRNVAREKVNEFLAFIRTMGQVLQVDIGKL